MKTSLAIFCGFLIGVSFTAWAYHDSYYIYPKHKFGVQTNQPWGNVNVYPRTPDRGTILTGTTNPRKERN